MKMLFTLLSLTTLSAFAMPTIGDYAKLGAMMGEDKLTMEYEIVDYDAASNSYQVNEHTRFANQPSSVKQTWMERDELMSEQEVQDLVTNCKKLGGTSEKVSTKVGKFETCKVLDESSQSLINVGKVPFGIVKISNNGVDLLLEDYKFGNKK